MLLQVLCLTHPSPQPLSWGRRGLSRTLTFSVRQANGEAGESRDKLLWVHPQLAPRISQGLSTEVSLGWTMYQKVIGVMETADLCRWEGERIER